MWPWLIVVAVSAVVSAALSDDDAPSRSSSYRESDEDVRRRERQRDRERQKQEIVGEAHDQLAQLFRTHAGVMDRSADVTRAGFADLSRFASQVAARRAGAELEDLAMLNCAWNFTNSYQSSKAETQALKKELELLADLRGALQSEIRGKK